MREFDVDFHVHSRYSGGTSNRMTLPVLANQAQLKGLSLVATGDALHPDWLKHMRNNLVEEKEGVYSLDSTETRFIIQVEVEDNARVHHVILLPNLEAAEDLRNRLYRFSKDIDRDGRPTLRLNGQQILDHVKEVGAMAGPSHAFTPWTALYKEYDSLEECYGDNLKYVNFLELGLSADTYMADRIEELNDLTFMSNSDTHSPWPHRLGREFNRVRIKELSYPEIEKAILRKNGRGFNLNVGLNPKEGKYHLTACSRCYLKFNPGDALRLKWRCPECSGRVKKGVMHRVHELSTWARPHHPEHRPSYAHIVPLAEVISLATGVKTLTSKTIGQKWDSLIEEHGTETNVLVDADVDELKRNFPEIGRIIQRFRKGRMHYIPGGGGKYGRPTLGKKEERFYGLGQASLNDF